MAGKLKKVFQEYPKSFWIITLASFIDSIGSFMLFPFFGFYLRSRFNIDYTGIGLIFTMYSVGGIVGGIIGGALTDRYGRKFVMLFGLVSSAFGTLAMGFVQTIEAFYVLAIISGLLGSTGGPARQAMITDILPPKKVSEGFGILRVAANLSATIGPSLGGFVSATTNNYMFLFIADAITSTITAIIVIFTIPETKPKPTTPKLEQIEKNEQMIHTVGIDEISSPKKEKNFLHTLKGYFQVLKDGAFMLFILVSALMSLVYMQMNSTLSVYLLDVHAFPEELFGLLLSMNALMVVLFQFWVTRKISKYSPMIMMAIGTLLYAVGFSMYGYVSEFWLFYFAMFIITIGEMIDAPFGMAVIGLFAPEDKRGRYMAVGSLSWMIPSLFGIVVAGLIMDNLSPSSLWYFAGALALIAALGYLGLHKITKKRFIEIEKKAAAQLDSQVIDDSPQTLQKPDE